MFMEAQIFSDSNFHQRKAAEEMLSTYKNKFRWTRNEIVLDVGSGPGIITSYLLKTLPDNVSKIVGVDNSTAMLSHARNKYSNPKLSFHKMDITEKVPENLTQFLPEDLKSVKFNKIFCFYLFHWLGENLQQSLYNLERLLETGGQGAAIHYTSSPTIATYAEIRQSPKWSPYLEGVNTDYNTMRSRPDPSEFVKNCLIEAALEPEDISLRSSHLEYSRSDLVALIRGIDPLLQYIPKSKHAEYMDELLAAVLSKCEVTETGIIKSPVTTMTCLFTKK